MQLHLLKNKIFFITILFLPNLFQSCSLTPGEGGTSSITGKVYLKEVNGSGIVTAEYFAPEENVYILFNEDSIYDESTKTSFNGAYQFQFLRKGTYTIFAYSNTSSLTNFQEPFSVEVEISENNQNVEAPLIVIEKK